VTRRVTERPEAAAAGMVKLVGDDGGAIQSWIQRLLDDPGCYAEMTKGGSPYGDGLAAERIMNILNNVDLP